MSANYEIEQKTLRESLIPLKADIEIQNDKTANVSEFVEKVRRYTEIKELTPAIVNEFIDYIMVSKKQMIDEKTVYPIDIYYESSGFHSMDGHPAVLCPDYGQVYYENSGFHSMDGHPAVLCPDYGQVYYENSGFHSIDGHPAAFCRDYGRVYYSGIGIINAPSAEEYEEMFQECLKQKHSDKKMA